MRYKLVAISDESTQFVSGYPAACEAARAIAREHATEVIIIDPEGRTIVLDDSEGHRSATTDEKRLGDWSPVYSPWRHGGWYVSNVCYPSGAVGCVSRNYPDRKWRIACDSRDGDHTYASRDAAARAERDLIAAGVLGP